MAAAKETLSAFITGRCHFGFTGLTPSAYQLALDTLELEYARAIGLDRKSSIDQKIADASSRTTADFRQPKQKENEILH